MGEHKDHGKSSFGRIDFDLLAELLDVKPGQTAADLGCGPGDYTVRLAELVGPTGRVIALDRWAEGVDRVAGRAAEADLTNVKTMVADLAEGTPVDNEAVDLALLSTVMHGLAQAGAASKALAEAARILKPGGVLAVVEFTPGADGSGPPDAIRLSPERIAGLAEPFGFSESKRGRLAANMYLLMLRRK